MEVLNVTIDKVMISIAFVVVAKIKECEYKLLLVVFCPAEDRTLEKDASGGRLVVVQVKVLGYKMGVIEESMP